MTLDVELLRNSFADILERQPDLTPRFYEILFERFPHVRKMFGRNSQRQQADMLAQALMAVMDHLEDAGWLTSTLKAMGAKHLDYGVTPPMYAWVGESLLATLAEAAGELWTPEVASQWAAAYGAISGMMLLGAEEAEMELLKAHLTAPRVRRPSLEVEIQVVQTRPTLDPSARLTRLSGEMRARRLSGEMPAVRRPTIPPV